MALTFSSVVNEIYAAWMSTSKLQKRDDFFDEYAKNQPNVINAIYSIISEPLGLKNKADGRICVDSDKASDIKKGLSKPHSVIMDHCLDQRLETKAPLLVEKAIVKHLDPIKVDALINNLSNLAKKDDNLSEQEKKTILNNAERSMLCVFLMRAIQYSLKNEKEAERTEKKETGKRNVLSELKEKGLPIVEKSGYINRRLVKLKANGEPEGNSFPETDILNHIGKITCIIAEGGLGKTTLTQNLRIVLGELCHYTAALACVNALDDKTSFRELIPDPVRDSIRFLIVDGVDEVVTTKDKKTLFKRLKEFADSRTIQFLFTTRTLADAILIEEQLGDTVVKLELLPFIDIDCIKLASQVLDDKESKKFLDLIGISPNETLSTFTTHTTSESKVHNNPFFFDKLLSIFERTGAIPNTKIDILETIIESTISREEDLASWTNNAAHDYIGDSERFESLLELFAVEKYIQPEKEDFSIFLKIFLDEQVNNPSLYARHICAYLQARGLLINGTFSHQLLLEYLTAKAYWNKLDAQDYSDDSVRDLFAHYNDSRWHTVFELFLSIAEEKSTNDRQGRLYAAIINTDLIVDYSLLFDRVVLDEFWQFDYPKTKLFIKDILTKSLDGRYPAYGPLFWYVPRYHLYSQLLEVLNEDFAGNPKALALARDVCFIFGGYNTVSEVSEEIDGVALFSKAKSQLLGVRRALCELFCTGLTTYEGGSDIYPRCFNVGEAKALAQSGAGMFTRATTPFDDELQLYQHGSLNLLDNKPIGFISLPYDKEKIENILSVYEADNFPYEHIEEKLSGIVFLPAEPGGFEGYDYIGRIDFLINKIRAIYLPENCCTKELRDSPFLCRTVYVDERGICYANTFGNVTLTDQLKSLSDFSFSGSEVRTIRIPGTIKSISKRAFADCLFLEKVEIEEGVESVDIDAFNGCSRLIELKIPETVQDLFYKHPCDGGTELNMPGLERIYLPNHLAYLMPDDDRVIIYDANQIPSSSLDNIPDHSFRGKTIETISIPKGTVSIGKYAFADCVNLEGVNFSDSVTTLGENCFDGCSKLLHIDVPDSVTHIGKRAFRNCLALKSIRLPVFLERLDTDILSTTSIRTITLPHNLKIICANAFDECNLLEEVVFSKSLATIEENAFSGCSSLPAIDLSICKNLRAIESGAFLCCSSLKNVYLPEGLQEIGAAAFWLCENLSEITIPKSVNTIGQGAFSDCNLKTVRISRKFEHQIKDIFGNLAPGAIQFID